VRTAAELARWDESKKWLHKVELLKSKLTDADGEVSKLSKANKSLRDIVSRLEREKLMLENRSKSAGGKTSARANIADIKMKETQMENARLKEELEASKHNITMQSSQGVETLKLRNKFMQDRIEAQERKITALELTKKVGGLLLFLTLTTCFRLEKLAFENSLSRTRF
jgi:predicted RNase H-like nuclease (RuvC/YqgF family)